MFLIRHFEDIYCFTFSPDSRLSDCHNFLELHQVQSGPSKENLRTTASVSPNRFLTKPTVSKHHQHYYHPCSPSCWFPPHIQEENLWNKCADFRNVSNHWRKLKALTTTSEISPTGLIPSSCPPGSQGKWRCCLNASSLMPNSMKSLKEKSLNFQIINNLFDDMWPYNYHQQTNGSCLVYCDVHQDDSQEQWRHHNVCSYCSRQHSTALGHHCGRSLCHCYIAYNSINVNN